MDRRRKLFFCSEVDPENCCSSCIDDENEGFDQRIDWDVGKNWSYISCCSHKKPEKENRNGWATLLWKMREHRRRNDK